MKQMTETYFLLYFYVIFFFFFFFTITAKITEVSFVVVFYSSMTNYFCFLFGKTIQQKNKLTNTKTIFHYEHGIWLFDKFPVWIFMINPFDDDIIIIIIITTTDLFSKQTEWSLVDQDSFMKCNQMKLIFQYNFPFSSHISSFGVAVLGSH